MKKIKQAKAPGAGPVHHREWFAALVDAIKRAIEQNRRDGIVAMGIENLRAIVPLPLGGPVGPNFRYFYVKDWFPAAVAALPARYLKDVLAEGGAR